MPRGGGGRQDGRARLVRRRRTEEARRRHARERAALLRRRGGAARAGHAARRLQPRRAARLLLPVRATHGAGRCDTLRPLPGRRSARPRRWRGTAAHAAGRRLGAARRADVDPARPRCQPQGGKGHAAPRARDGRRVLDLLARQPCRAPARRGARAPRSARARAAVARWRADAQRAARAARAARATA